MLRLATLGRARARLHLPLGAVSARFCNVSAAPPPQRKKRTSQHLEPVPPAAAATTDSVPEPDSIERCYQKKTPVEHVLLRPGMYIGAVEAPAGADAWVFDAAAGRMVLARGVRPVPGLVKLFDEILVNACDNRVRDARMARLEVDIDAGAGGGNANGRAGPPRITVLNDGAGIPVALHRGEGVYVPELVLGQLLTGSNFGDAAEAAGGAATAGGATAAAPPAAAASGTTAGTTGGRHGYGAKLTNIFSNAFTVDTVDAVAGLRYTQTWRRNMRDRGEPVVTPVALSTTRTRGGSGGSGGGYTRITFEPDTARFRGAAADDGVSVAAPPLDADTLDAMRRRVWDAAGTLGDGVAVVLNGERLPIAGFEAYARLFTPPPPPAAVAAAEAGSEGADEIDSGASSDEGRALWAAGGGAPLSPAHAAARLSRLAYARLPNGWEVAVGAAGLPIRDSAGADAAAAAALEPYNEPGAVASFVNSMATPRGGSHVAVVLDALCRRVAAVVAKRVGASEALPPVTPAAVRPHLRLWLSARVAHPTFDSQSKEALVTPAAALTAAATAAAAAAAPAAAATPTDAGSFPLPDRFVRAVANDAGVADAVLGALRARAASAAARAVRRTARAPESRVKAIPKLEDANWAGARRSRECTLILTEGDSAKALAVAGLAVVGRDRYGVFPLRGKLLNVRDLAPAAALGNAEVAAVVQILGLQFGREYGGAGLADAAAWPLRYGRVLIMADQDVDGSHIKGLLLNLFHTFWPSLLRDADGGAGADRGGFLQAFVTPLIKARNARTGAMREFFSAAEFDAWRGEGRGAAASAGGPAAAAVARGGRSPGEASVGSWTFKYYKGLGTSTSAEGRAYFGDLPRYVRPFAWGGDGDGRKLEMAFSKGAAAARREWLTTGGGGDGAEAEAGKGGRAPASTPPSPPAAPLPAPLLPSVTLLGSLGADALGGVAPLPRAGAVPAPPPAGTPSLSGAGAPADAAVASPAAPPAATARRRKAGAAAAATAAAAANAVLAVPAARGGDGTAASAAASGRVVSPPETGAATTFSTFVDSELRAFSQADLLRSIPALLDGLKPSQRKVLFACFKRAGGGGASGVGGRVTSGGGDEGGAVGADTVATSAAGSASEASQHSSGPLPPSAAAARRLVAAAAAAVGPEVKVAQLVGYVSEHTAYHHGEAALTGTVARMAQDYVGANNVPLLAALGQFGTRLAGGKDAASPRYIYTRLSPLARLLFPAGDDALLRRRDDDGAPVEPVSYVPIVPLVLLNGAEGIGTGWATSVPRFHPVEVIAALEAAVAGARESAAASAAGAGGDGGAMLLERPAALRRVLQRLTAAGDALVPWSRGFSGATVPVAGDPAALVAAAAVPPLTYDDGNDGGAATVAGTSAAPAARSFTTFGVATFVPPPGRGGGARVGGAGDAGRPAGPGAQRKLKTAAAAAPGRPLRTNRFSNGETDGDDSGRDDDDGDYGGGGGGTPASPWVRVTELPLGRWTEDYKAFLRGLVDSGALATVAEFHTEAAVDFLVKLTPSGAAAVAAARARAPPATAAAAAAAGVDVGLASYFKLSAPLGTSNMHLFAPPAAGAAGGGADAAAEGAAVVRRYATPGAILAAFFPVRLAMFAARKARAEALLAFEAARAGARARFVSAVVGGGLVLGRRAAAEVEAELWATGYPALPPARGGRGGGGGGVDDDGVDGDEGATAAASAGPLPPAVAAPLSALLDHRALRAPQLLLRGGGGGGGSTATETVAAPASADAPPGAYDYLLGMPLSSLTREAAARADAAAATARARLEGVRAQGPEDAWLLELAALRLGLAQAGGYEVPTTQK